MSFRIWPPGVQFFTNDGKVLAGGSLTFSDSGTTTPRPTYSDPGLTTPNSNPVVLDGAGRPNTDIWAEGSYRIVLRSSLGAVLVTLDNVSGPVGIPDPALQAGKFLSNDGTNVFWVAIRQVPDPTGQPDGNVLTTDGAGNTAWEPLPTPPVPPASPTVDIGATSIELGESTGGDRFLIQTGTASAPASGGHTTTANVAFPTIFTAGALYAGAVATNFPVGAAGFGAVICATSISNSGFTISIDTNDGGSGANIVNPVSLRWFAMGLVTPPP